MSLFQEDIFFDCFDEILSAINIDFFASHFYRRIMQDGGLKTKRNVISHHILSLLCSQIYIRIHRTFISLSTFESVLEVNMHRWKYVN